MAGLGLGEASSVLAVVQLGFTLASSLYTFVSDIRDAEDNIQSLGSELDATTRHLENLSKLIQSNPTTKGWDENGLALAKKCVTDCQKSTEKLGHLLSKSAPKKGQALVNGKEPHVSKFDKVTWPAYKPQFLILKQELVLIRTDILLAHTTYKCNVAPSGAEKSDAYNSLAPLFKRQQKAKKQLQKVRRREQRQSTVKGVEAVSNNENMAEPNSRLRRSRKDSTSPRAAFKQQDLSSQESYASSVTSSTLKRELDSFERHLVLQIKQEEEQKRVTTVKQERLQRLAEENAVRRFKEGILEASEKRRKDAADAEQKLRNMPGLDLDAKQLAAIIAELHPSTDSDKMAFVLQQKSSHAGSVSTSTEHSKDTRHGSEPGRIRRVVTKAAIKLLARREASYLSSVPRVLRDDSRPDGFAQTESWVFNWAGRTKPSYMSVYVPFPVVVKTMTRREKLRSRDWGDMWKDLSSLPYHCREDIIEWRYDGEKRGIWLALLFTQRLDKPVPRGQGADDFTASILVVCKVLAGKVPDYLTEHRDHMWSDDSSDSGDDGSRRRSRDSTPSDRRSRGNKSRSSVGSVHSFRRFSPPPASDIVRRNSRRRSPSPSDVRRTPRPPPLGNEWNYSEPYVRYPDRPSYSIYPDYPGYPAYGSYPNYQGYGDYQVYERYPKVGRYDATQPLRRSEQVSVAKDSKDRPGDYTDRMRAKKQDDKEHDRTKASETVRLMSYSGPRRRTSSTSLDGRHNSFVSRGSPVIHRPNSYYGPSPRLTKNEEVAAMSTWPSYPGERSSRNERNASDREPPINIYSESPRIDKDERTTRDRTRSRFEDSYKRDDTAARSRAEAYLLQKELQSLHDRTQSRFEDSYKRDDAARSRADPHLAAKVRQRSRSRSRSRSGLKHTASPNNIILDNDRSGRKEDLYRSYSRSVRAKATEHKRRTRAEHDHADDHASSSPSSSSSSSSRASSVAPAVERNDDEIARTILRTYTGSGVPADVVDEATDAAADDDGEDGPSASEPTPAPAPAPAPVSRQATVQFADEEPLVDRIVSLSDVGTYDED